MNRIEVNNIQLAYKDSGNGTPVVLLHGNSGTHKEMTLFEGELSKTHRVISFDLRGHGLSEVGKHKYSIQLLAKDILAACENLGITTCDAIGYSDGGNIVLTINVLKPGFVSRSVLVSPNYAVTGMKTTWVIWLNIVYGISLIGKVFKRKYGGLNSKTRLMVRKYRLAEKDLQRIKSETLILEAEKDMIKHSHLMKLKNLIPKSTSSIIEGTSHFTIINNSRTIDVVNDFLSNE